MELILLERIARLGAIGDVVNVKNGFGRNYLIPTGKALRANKKNKEVVEAQKDQLEAQNQVRKGEAQKQASTLDGIVVTVIRQASDDGKLYGSVAVRDVSDALEAAGHKVDRRYIDLNATIKSLGLYEVTIGLHAEVPVKIKVHVARNADSPLPQDMQEADAAAKAQEAMWAEQAAAKAAAAEAAAAATPEDADAPATDEDAA